MVGWYRQILRFIGALVIGATPFGAVWAQDAATPRYGGTMIVAGTLEPDHFNPALTLTDGVRPIAFNVLPRIVRLTLDLEVEPFLADRWEISEDGLTYTFHIRPEAVWEDGVPITAHDVAYTWGEIIPEFNIQGAAISSNWQEVAAEDDHTLVVRLTRPQPTFLLEAAELGILPKHRYEGTDILTNPLNTHPISGGPFKFKTHVRGSHVELVRNELFWDQNLPYLDRVIYRFIPDANARLLALEAGDIDYTAGYMSVGEALRLTEKNPDLHLEMGGHWGLASISSTLLFNLRREPFTDVRVRRAIAHAIDRDFIFQVVTQGTGRIAYTHFGSGNWAHNREGVPEYAYDPERAATLLDEAGYPIGADGKRFSIDLVVATNQAEHLAIMNILVDYLARVGIELRPRPLEAQAFNDAVFINWDFDTVLRGIATGVNPTSHAAWRAYYCSNIKRELRMNNEGYCNPQADALFDAARDAPTLEAMAPFLHELQILLMTDLPSIPLLERFEPYVWNKALAGDILDVSEDYSRIWREDYSRIWRVDGAARR